MPAKQSYRWPLIVIGLLGTHFVLMIVAATIATHDRSFAVMPNYYEQGLNWDKSQALKRQSEKLGWKITIAPATTVDSAGRRAVEIVLADAQGHAIPSARVEITYFHHANATQLFEIAGTTSHDGRIALLTPMRTAGFYDFRCTASANNVNFATTITDYVSNAP